jgi:hypothetical protein
VAGTYLIRVAGCSSVIVVVVMWGNCVLGSFFRIWVVLVFTFPENDLYSLSYIVRPTLCIFVSRMVIYYHVKAILVILGITLTLFVTGLGGND